MARLYLAGPMSSKPYHNRPAFDFAADVLRAWGYDVVNPIDIDIALWGEELFDDPTGDVRSAMVRVGFDLEHTLRVDLDQIFDRPTAVVALTGWEDSPGARTELNLACALGVPIVEFDVWLDMGQHALGQAMLAFRTERLRYRKVAFSA